MGRVYPVDNYPKAIFYSSTLLTQLLSQDPRHLVDEVLDEVFWLWVVADSLADCLEILEWLGADKTG
jgi:hypothetical protein